MTPKECTCCTVTERRRDPTGYALWHLQSPFRNGRLEVMTYEVKKAVGSSVQRRLCVPGELGTSSECVAMLTPVLYIAVSLFV